VIAIHNAFQLKKLKTHMPVFTVLLTALQNLSLFTFRTKHNLAP